VFTLNPFRSIGPLFVWQDGKSLGKGGEEEERKTDKLTARINVFGLYLFTSFFNLQCGREKGGRKRRKGEEELAC